jgi:methionyl-tRNA synthetase
MSKETITYEDFAKLDLRVATIEKVEEIEGADKLYKLTLNNNRTICAGIKEHYKKEDLIGKQIIIIANLAPRKLKNVVSEGMLLAADENGKPTLLIPENKVKDNSEIH